MSKTVHAEWTTTLSVAELAGWFKATAQDRFASMGRMTKLALRGRGLEFFTPRNGDDPFVQFETQPAFSVGVTMPRGGSFAGSGEMVTLHMYVTDADDRRIVELAAPVAGAMDQFRAGARREGLIGHSSKGAKALIEHFGETLAASDPQARRSS